VFRAGWAALLDALTSDAEIIVTRPSSSLYTDNTPHHKDKLYPDCAKDQMTMTVSSEPQHNKIMEKSRQNGTI